MWFENSGNLGAHAENTHAENTHVQINFVATHIKALQADLAPRCGLLITATILACANAIDKYKKINTVYKYR